MNGVIIGFFLRFFGIFACSKRGRAGNESGPKAVVYLYYGGRAMWHWQVPPVFAAARNALYSRYTDNDWMASNMSNYLASNRVRGASERVRYDTVTMCHELDDKTKRTQVSRQ